MLKNVQIEREDNRKVLSKNLIDLVSGGVNISKVTIKDVVENSGISRSNFYNYFSDIYSLLDWTYREELTPQFEDMFELGMHREALKYMFYKIDQDRDFYLNIFIYDKDRSVDKFVERLVFEFFQTHRNLVDRGVSSGNWYNTHIAGKAAANVFGFVVKEWMSSNFSISVDEILDFSIFIRNVNIHNIFKGHD